MNEEQFFERLRTSFNIDLTQQQKEVATHINGPCLVLAVPGGGKTTTLLSRTAFLIYNGIKPENILSVTFSKMSATDMDERFNKIFGDIIEQDIKFSTIHSFAYKIVREYNYKNNIKIYMIEGSDKSGQDISKIKLLKNIYKTINKELLTEEELDDLVNKIGFVKNMMITDIDFNNYDWKINNFKEIYQTYEKIKKENSYIDYDDMLSGCLNILQTDKKILDKYRNIYKYIQVDEAQDTSRVQHEIIKVLTNPENNVFYVADDDQSIYGFRGAYPEFLLSIEETFPNTKIYRMEENFRSTKNIVSICNNFIKKNATRFNKEIFTNNNDGEKIQIISVQNRGEQINNLVKTLVDLKKSNSTTAVLYRNNLSSIILAYKLYSSNIPFKLKGFKRGFFNHWILDDVFSFLTLAANNKDIEAFEKIYYKMDGYYISKEMINYIKKDKRDISIFDKLWDINLIEDYRKENIRRLKCDFTILSSKNIENMFNFIEFHLRYNKLTSPSNKQVFYTLKELSKGVKSIDEYKMKLQNLERVMSKSVYTKDENPVILSTTHSCKGLEWDNVYIIDIIDGVFPDKTSMKDDKKAIEEERRLFYVGMTRSRKNLNLYKVEYKDNNRKENSLFITEVERLLGKVPNSFKNQSFESGNSKELRQKLLNFSKEQIFIEHKKFGKGLVKNIDKTNIEIVFEGNQTKKFLMDFCLKNNLIRISEE